MVRCRPLTPAAAVPDTTLARPQARPHGSCEAQPRARHGPSDFRLPAPVERTAHAGNARLLDLPCLAAHAAAAAAAAPRPLRLWRGPPRAYQKRERAKPWKSSLRATTRVMPFSRRAASANTPPPRVTAPPHRVYSPMKPLRQHISAKYTYIFRHIGRSLLAATSRASRASLRSPCVCDHVYRMVYRSQFPPWTAYVPLYDHMYTYGSETTYVDRINLKLFEPFSCATSTPSPRHHVYRSLATRMVPRPRATTELPVSVSTHTAAIDDPLTHGSPRGPAHAPHA